MFKFFNRNKSTVTAQEEWRRKTLAYAKAISAFVEKGENDGWENAGGEPKAPALEHLVPDLLKALKAGQKSNTKKSISDLWPPAHGPLIDPIIKEKGQSIPVVALLDDGSFIARIGSSYQDGYIVRVNGHNIERVSDVSYFGQGPNKNFFASIKENGVSITDGWQGPQTAFCPWPTGLEDVPAGYDVKKFDSHPNADQLIPFPDGQRVLLIGEDGIFVLSSEKARRLIPTIEAQKDFYDFLTEENPEDPLTMDLSMPHGAISHDGQMIAVGCQSESHNVFDENLNLIADIGNLSEYPHYAVFSKDDKQLALNSCHFYNGVTLGVPTKLFGNYSTEMYKLDNNHVLLNDEDRVYAAVSSNNLYITGNAAGYVRGFDRKGNNLFKIFLGSSIGDIDISKDETRLLVSTYAGFIALYDLNADVKADHQIGIGNVLELQRWIFWKNEVPMLW